MKGKELLLIAISSFILTIIWVASNVYHAYATSTLDSLLQVQIVPISPDFDMATIAKLRARTAVAPLSVVATPTPIAVSPTITPTPTQEITPTVIPLPTDIVIPTDITPTEIPTVTP